MIRAFCCTCSPQAHNEGKHCACAPSVALRLLTSRRFRLRMVRRAWSVIMSTCCTLLIRNASAGLSPRSESTCLTRSCADWMVSLFRDSSPIMSVPTWTHGGSVASEGSQSTQGYLLGFSQDFERSLDSTAGALYCLVCAQQPVPVAVTIARRSSDDGEIFRRREIWALLPEGHGRGGHLLAAVE
jgi:hypothetical protein